MSLQDRGPLSMALQQHANRPAGSLLARQIQAMSASAAFLPRKDTALCDATAGAVLATLPVGSTSITGLPWLAFKTDETENEAGLQCAGSDTFPDGSTTLTTTVPDGMVAAMWDGATWRRTEAGAADAATVVPPTVVYVTSAADFPAAVAGVRTLADRTMYIQTVEEVDLGTDTLLASECVTIVGLSPECTRLKTANAAALISTTDNLDIRTISLVNTLGPCVAVDGGSALAEVTANLVGVNFTGVGAVVKLEDGAFFIVDRCAWLGCSGVGIAVAGGILGLAISGSASRGNANGFVFVSVPNTATIASRVRLVVCNIEAPTGGVGLSVDPAAVGDERVVLLGCAFSGPGAATTGVTPSSAKAYFKSNTGLESTAPIAACSISGNVTGTAATANVAFKLAGATTERASQLFTVAADNRATYVGSKARTFLVIITGTLVTVATNAVVKLLVAVDGVVGPGYVAGPVTAQGPTGLRAESMTLVAVLKLAPGQYVEAWGEVTSGSTTVTWAEGQVVITESGG